MFQSALGYIVSACLNVAVKMRIPDLIGEGVYELGALARRAGAQEDALFRVLRVLEMNGLVTRNGHRSYELTPSGQLLRRDSEGSLAAAVEWISDPLHLTLYSELQSSIETGETTFDAVYGMPFFDWSAREENAEEADVFNNAMTSVSQLCIPAFLEAYSFGSFERIVDVGGGHGAVLRSILKEHAGVSGTLAEMASLIPAANAAIANDGLSNRCEAVACNFFEIGACGRRSLLHETHRPRLGRRACASNCCETFAPPFPRTEPFCWPRLYSTTRRRRISASCWTLR